MPAPSLRLLRSARFRRTLSNKTRWSTRASAQLGARPGVAFFNWVSGPIGRTLHLVGCGDRQRRCLFEKALLLMELPKRHATFLHGEPFSVDAGWPVAAAFRRPRPVCADGRPGHLPSGPNLSSIATTVASSFGHLRSGSVSCAEDAARRPDRRRISGSAPTSRAVARLPIEVARGAGQPSRHCPQLPSERQHDLGYSRTS